MSEVIPTDLEVKHTPGPWIAYPETIRVGEKPVANRMAVQAVDEDGPVGHISFSDANARLIAAAPDLWAALTRLVGTPVGWDALNHEPGCGCVGHEARYAICKVLGLGKEHAK